MVAAGIDETRIKVRIGAAGIDITLRSKGEAAGTDDGAERNEWDEVLPNDGKKNA
jgi:hypothetical protein